MAKTIGNYTWEDIYGVTAAKDGTNIGIRCYLYLTATQSYGSCYAFFNISYTPLSNQKLRVTINSIQLRQDKWTTRDWVLSGSVKVNGSTLFSGGLSTSSGTSYGSNTNITVGSSYYVDIDYPNDQEPLTLNYDFSLYFKTDIYSTAWKGWTNSDEDTCSTSYTYSHIHSYTNTVTAATCTTQGYTTHKCSSCGYSYKDTYTAALGHGWDSGVITTEPTYTTDGVMTYTCTRCNTKNTYIISKFSANKRLVPTVFIEGEEYTPYVYTSSAWCVCDPKIHNGTGFEPY